MSLLDLIISPAAAQAAGAAAAPSPVPSIVMMVALFGIMYFLMIRPQMKRAKEQKAMIEALQKGDEVITAGGVVGKITKLSDNYATVQIAPNVEIHVQRPAVQLVLPKGTIKGIE